MTVEAAPTPLRVAVIGGGIAGLTLAIALHGRNINVTVYERSAAFGEIGAGVSFSPNAVRAMHVCHEGVVKAFESVSTGNTWPEKSKVFFDFVRGYGPDQSIAFTAMNEHGQNSVHRADFLDALVPLLPRECASFGKSLIGLSQDEKEVTMSFADGTTATADVVIGCDGIKSRTRRLLFGEDASCALPTYTHKYAYRGLVPVEKATEVVGPEMGQNSFMHLGPGGHMLTFPVRHGKTLNVVAFKQDDGEWLDTERLTRKGTRTEALKDFEGWSQPVRRLLELCDEELSVWAIFNLETPPPSYNVGRVAISGDAAHATSPHHGAGAGFCVEDAAVLASLLAETTPETVSAALEAYDASRRERGDWLVRASRRCGQMYDWQTEHKDDMEAIYQELEGRHEVIYGVDIGKMCADAVDDMTRRASS